MSSNAVRRSALVVALTAAVFSFAGCSRRGNSPDITPHLITVPDASPERPVDSYEPVAMSAVVGALSEEDYRDRVEELYSIVVYDRKKPVFAPDDPVEPIYNAAVGVLDTYVLNDWHKGTEQIRIIHTVHDWLAYTIKYDMELYREFQSGNAVIESNPAFDIDGVFLNGLAVCDGLSRAFNFLCAIENIESLRVTGSYASVPHAWNKVKLDGKWYNVDVTADATEIFVGAESSKQLSHGFFMLSDETMRSFVPRLHNYEVQSWSALEDYDYYSGKMTAVGDVKFPSVITDQSVLNDLFEKISKQKGAIGKIEIKLDFSGKTDVNKGDMYAKEIAEAYSKLKNPDFVFDIDRNRPYIQYPNGVYTILMYR